MNNELTGFGRIITMTQCGQELVCETGYFRRGEQCGYGLQEKVTTLPECEGWASQGLFQNGLLTAPKLITAYPILNNPIAMPIPFEKYIRKLNFDPPKLPEEYKEMSHPERQMDSYRTLIDIQKEKAQKLEEERKKNGDDRKVDPSEIKLDPK